VGSRKELRSPAHLDFHIGDWLAQPALNLINAGDRVRRLEPQVMDLLVFLAGSGGRVISKNEMIDAVWEGRFIAEATLTRSVADLRRALGDDQRRPQYIETIAKRGYRLVAAVSPAGERRRETADGPAPQMRDGTADSNAIVLPFAKEARVSSCARAGETAGARIADRLESARWLRFVGRQAEIEMFRAALRADEPPFVALHVTGPGGVGKTTLLEAFARAAGDAGRAIVRLDGRSIEPSAAGLLAALGRAVGAGRIDMAGVREQWPAGAVLLVDTCELLSPIDDFLRETLLPQLPARSFVVMAGRNEPSPAWRLDMEWAGLTRVHPLGNLAADDSRTYLTRCGVPAEHHDAALAFTRGHPLALSIIADVLTRGDRLTSCRLDSEPDVIRQLLEKFVQEVPSREHRLALHACVTVWATTEPLLAAVLGRDDAHDLFEWVGQLSFVEHGPYGLFPHDPHVARARGRFRDRRPPLRRVRARLARGAAARMAAPEGGACMAHRRGGGGKPIVRIHT
jgi:DNA-binding winged helix-turn-helix (wHTH) protein